MYATSNVLRVATRFVCVLFSPTVYMLCWRRSTRTGHDGGFSPRFASRRRQSCKITHAPLRARIGPMGALAALSPGSTLPRPRQRQEPANLRIEPTISHPVRKPKFGDKFRRLLPGRCHGRLRPQAWALNSSDDRIPGPLPRAQARAGFPQSAARDPDRGTPRFLLFARTPLPWPLVSHGTAIFRQSDGEDRGPEWSQVAGRPRPGDRLSVVGFGLFPLKGNVHECTVLPRMQHFMYESLSVVFHPVCSVRAVCCGCGSRSYPSLAKGPCEGPCPEPTTVPHWRHTPAPVGWPGFASTTGWGCGIRQRAALIPPLRCTPSPVAPDPQCPVVAPPEDHLHRLSRSNLGVPREVPQRTVAAKRGVARLGLGLHATVCRCLSVGNSLFRLKQALLPANRRPGPRL